MTSSTIASIETTVVRYPTVRPFRFLSSNGTRTTRDTVVVRISTADGSCGWGQCVPSRTWSYETIETVCSTIDRYLAPALLGLDIFDREAIGKVMESEIAPGYSIGQPICKAGIDLAIFDWTGRKTQQAAHQRWKRPFQSAVTLSWTIDARDESQLELEVEASQRRGYRHFNVKVGRDPRRDLSLCAALRRLAPNSLIWVDANGGYDLETAIAIAPKFADLGMIAFEQPLAANRLIGYRRLRRQGALPIVMDEGVATRVDLQEFHQLELLDGVAMKVSRCGGLSESQQMLEYIEQEGLLLMASGLTDPDWSFAASLLLFSAYGLSLPAALNAPQFLEHSVLAEPIRLIGDQAQVPIGNGLAVTISTEGLCDGGAFA